MQRLKIFVCALLSALMLLSVPVLAFKLPNTIQHEGVPCVGIFEIAKWKENGSDSFGVYDFWLKFQSSPRNVVLYRTPPEEYIILCLPEDAIGTVTQTSSSSIEFKTTRSNGMLINVPWMSFKRSGDLLVYSDSGMFASSSYSGVVSGTYFSINPPTGLSQSVIAEYPGDVLGFMDDLEDTPPPDDGGGILGWLDGFWDGLLKFFKSIFIPREGYFDDWFKEIYNAAMGKLGSLADVSNALGTAFETMKNYSGTSGLKLVVPKDTFFRGFSGITVDLLSSIAPMLKTIKGWLTACCVVLTAISCYKRLIVLFEQ